jgi:hypothetical protein
MDELITVTEAARRLGVSRQRIFQLCKEGRARRRAIKLQATPAWANQALIYSFYRMAEVFGLEVDHIIPLISKKVCGFHVEHNLQLLTKAENARKSNRFQQVDPPKWGGRWLGGLTTYIRTTKLRLSKGDTLDEADGLEKCRSGPSGSWGTRATAPAEEAGNR